MVENKTEPDPVERAIELAKPVIAQLGFGGVMGYCSGLAMKKIGKAVAFGVGVIFISLQAAVSTGYISVDWAKISDDTIKKLDTTGEGKVDAEDLKVYWRKLKALLIHKLPSSSGFSLGFLYGVRYG